MIWVLGGYVWLYLHRPFEVWPFLGTLQIERLYALGMILVWFFHTGKAWPQNRLHWAFIFFAFAIVICWVGSPYPQYLGEQILETFCKVFVVYVLFVTCVRDERSLRQILIIFFVALAVYEAHSLLEYLNGRYEYRMKVVRMKGVDLTHGDPNSFSATLLHALPFLVPFWLTTHQPRSRWWILSYVGLTTLCIFLTGSRRAFVGCCLLLGWLVLRSRRRLLLLVLLLFLAPMAWFSLRADLQNRFLTLVDSSYGPKNAQESGMSRYNYFLQSFELWNESPITGVGPGAFGKAGGHGMQPHNLYAQVIGEMGTLGIVGLSLIVWGFWSNTREIERLYQQRPWWPKDFVYYVGRISWFAVFLLLFMGIGGHNLYRYNWLWFGAFQVAAVGIARRRALQEVTEPSLLHVPQGVIPAYVR